MIQKAFVRLAPTVLYLAPPCYGKYELPCIIKKIPCPVETQCSSLQLPELVAVKKEQYEVSRS